MSQRLDTDLEISDSQLMQATSGYEVEYDDDDEDISNSQLMRCVSDYEAQQQQGMETQGMTFYLFIY